MTTERPDNDTADSADERSDATAAVTGDDAGADGAAAVAGDEGAEGAAAIAEGASDDGRAEAGRDDAEQGDTEHTDATHGGAEQSDTGHASAEQGDTEHPDATHGGAEHAVAEHDSADEGADGATGVAKGPADDGRAEAGRDDAEQGDTAHGESRHAGAEQDDAEHTDATHADADRTDTTRADAEHADTQPTGADDDAVAAASAPATVSDPAVSSPADVPHPAEVPHPTEVPGPHEVEPTAPSRRRSPVLVASVAAAVLLVGGGGAYLAAGASGGSGAGSGASGDGSTPPPLALDGYSEGGSNGIAPGEPNPYGVTYKVDGTLPDGPGSAPVYRAAGEVGKGEVARLAKALGLTGTPVVRGQSWQVGSGNDGSGPSLVVDRQAPGTWTFRRYAAGTDDCKGIATCTKDPANPAGATVSEAAAKKAVAPVLKAVGQDDAKVDASQVMGAQRAVNANPRVGGLPTYGWSTGLTVSAQGEVVGGTGRLKAPVKGDTYPVLDAKKTLELMNSAPSTDHRMGIGGCASPVPLKDRLEQPCGRSTPSAAPKQTVTVEDAVFGLAARAVGGRQALVPSWLFQVKGAGTPNGFTVTYPAVDPRYLASNTTPTPSATAPGDQPSSAPATRDVKVDGYTAEGDELTVSFTGGVCADYEATASENANAVAVKVTEKPWKGKVCIMIAKEFRKTVQLDGPLGDRKVTGSDGRQIPQLKQGARLPRTAGVQ
ncbi:MULTISPECIES: hypothetical protein [Streptomyces]|uniref:hypothetical protein n=1 Tax=Streptomyces TaxID=1883 RepID=UPI003558DC02